jgi:fibronectin type 3 domain-containing protein
VSNVLGVGTTTRNPFRYEVRGLVDDVRIHNSALTADAFAVFSGTQPSAPATPTGLSATAGNAQIVLAWSAVSGATSYNVKRATSSGGPYTTVSSPTSTSFTNTGLTNGATYYYVVSAENAQNGFGRLFFAQHLSLRGNGHVLWPLGG